MPLGNSKYNCLWILSGYMMTILSQQFFLHNRYLKYQQITEAGKASSNRMCCLVSWIESSSSNYSVEDA